MPKQAIGGNRTGRAKGTTGQGRGWEGVVLEPPRAKDFTLGVTGTEDATDHYRRLHFTYRRLHFTDGGLVPSTGVHPTTRVRLWFDNAGRPHQRTYTLVDPDPADGTFSLEFAVHEGCASGWTRAPAAYVRKELRLPKRRVHALGYWRANQPDKAPASGAAP